jgi:hypothetical protein
MSESAGAAAPSVPSTPSVSESSAPEISSESSASESSSAPTAPQMVKVKIDGQIVELPLEEVTAGYQRTSAANKRLSEAAAERKKVEAERAEVAKMKEYLRKNPTKALLEDGVDLNDVITHYEEVLWERIQEEKRSPEEKESLKTKRETEKAKAELAAMRAEIAAENTRKEEAKRDQETLKWQEEYSKQILTTLQSKNLPVNDDTVYYLTSKMQQALENEVDLSFDDIATAYKEDREIELKNLLSSLSADQLAELYGEDRMKQVRAKDVASLKNPTKVETPVNLLSKDAKPVQKKESMSEYFKRLDRIAKYGK